MQTSVWLNIHVHVVLTNSNQLSPPLFLWSQSLLHLGRTGGPWPLSDSLQTILPGLGLGSGSSFPVSQQAPLFHSLSTHFSATRYFLFSITDSIMIAATALKANLFKQRMRGGFQRTLNSPSASWQARTANHLLGNAPAVLSCDWKVKAWRQSKAFKCHQAGLRSSSIASWHPKQNAPRLFKGSTYCSCADCLSVRMLNLAQSSKEKVPLFPLTSGKAQNRKECSSRLAFLPFL